MKTLSVFAMFIGLGAMAFAQTGQSAGQDMKDAANSTKSAAKKAGHKTKKETKHAAHATADAADKGANKVKDATK